MSLALSVIADDTIQRKIDALSDYELLSKLSVIVRTRALDVVNGAKGLAPVSTGAYRRSIQFDTFSGGLAAIIGSFLPYAARQEFDATLDHSVRPARRRKINTKSGKVGSIIKGTAQFNPRATWGALRKSLHAVGGYFLADIKDLLKGYADGFNQA